MEFQTVKELITGTLTDAQVQVHDLTGTQDHLGLLVISDEFKGVKLLEQHRMVMDILKEKLGTEEIHAVQIKTMTFEKAKAKGVEL